MLGPEATRWPHLSLKQRKQKTGVDVHKHQSPHTRVWPRIRDQAAMFILCCRFGCQPSGKKSVEFQNCLLPVNWGCASTADRAPWTKWPRGTQRKKKGEKKEKRKKGKQRRKKTKRNVGLRPSSFCLSFFFPSLFFSLSSFSFSLAARAAARAKKTRGRAPKAPDCPSVG